MGLTCMHPQACDLSAIAPWHCQCMQQVRAATDAQIGAVAVTEQTLAQLLTVIMAPGKHQAVVSAQKDNARWWILHPHSRLVTFWTWLIYMLAIFYFLEVPISIAYGTMLRARAPSELGCRATLDPPCRIHLLASRVCCMASPAHGTHMPGAKLRTGHSGLPRA